LDDIKESVIQKYINEQKAFAMTDFNPDDIWVPSYVEVTKSADGKTISFYSSYSSTVVVPPQAPRPNSWWRVNVWDLLVEEFTDIKETFLEALDAFIAWFE
jgi:hypothetical protein